MDNGKWNKNCRIGIAQAEHWIHPEDTGSNAVAAAKHKNVRSRMMVNSLSGQNFRSENKSDRSE